jgi:two-component system response regulator
VSLTPIRILLIEDSAADIRLTQEVFRDGKFVNELSVVRDGEEALDYLYQRGEHAMAPRPDLVLLDLNLPKLDGREVLEVIKSDPSLRSIPVAVLTTSSNDRDILQSYNLGANCYLTKPVDLEEFVAVVNKIEEFWLGIVRLPSATA